MISSLWRHVYIDKSLQYLPILHYLPSVNASYEYQKNEHVQQWNLFKCQITNVLFFSSTIKLLTPNVYCLSCKALVVKYWTHLRVNGIWMKSFHHRKRITEHCFLRDAFNGTDAIFIVYKWCTADFWFRSLAYFFQLLLNLLLEYTWNV